MDRSPAWLGAALSALAVVAAAQDPTAARTTMRRPPAPALPEVVVARGVDQPAYADLGLGDGGVEGGAAGVRWDGDDVLTPGGVLVACRTAGVKLTFPSGRELLLAPDGTLHLRGGETGGPFAGGCELRLFDGSSVRATLAPSSPVRLREVTVGFEDRRLQPWRNGARGCDVVRDAGWAGPRSLCAGDGGDVFRAIALGPLLVLDRVLCAEERRATTPAQRLVVLAEPLVDSLRVMQRQHREPKAEVRAAITQVAELAAQAGAILPPGEPLPRAERDRLRWLLRGGFELEYEATGPMAPRLQLFAGDRPLPMIEWTLRADSAAFLTNPRDDQPGKRWHGNGTRLARAVATLQARDELHERALAVAVIDRLRAGAPAR